MRYWFALILVCLLLLGGRADATNDFYNFVNAAPSAGALSGTELLAITKGSTESYQTTTGAIAGLVGSQINLGTSGSATNPRRSGQAGTGLYSALSNEVQVAINGNNVATFLATGLQVDLNSAALPAAQSGTILQLGNANSTSSRLELDGFAASSYFSGVRYDGTAASPTTLQSGDEIGGYNAWGYNGSAVAGPAGAFRIYAAQNWTTSAEGTYADIATTPNGATAEVEVIRFENNGGITVPSTVTGGNQGPGTINAGGLYVNGVAVLTSTGGVNLGTVASATNPQRSGQNGTGLFSATSNTVSVAAAGSDALDIGTTGITAAGTATATAMIPTGTTAPTTGGLYYPGSLTPAIGVNGYPAMYFGESGAAVNFLQAISEASGTAPVLKCRGGDTNVGCNFVTQGTGGFTFTVGSTTAMTIGTTAINVPYLTASELVSTDGSSNLISTTALPSGTTTTTQSSSDNSTKVATDAFVQTAAAAITLGTSASATNPRRSSEATTGFYSLNSGEIDAALAGTLSFKINSQSVFIGSGVGSAGNGNVYIGYLTGPSASGYGNTLVGQGAGYHMNSSADDNLYYGLNAGSATSSGSNNVAIGINVGSVTLATGTYNILIGSSSAVDTVSSSTSYNLNIGNLLQGDMTNSTALGREALFLQSTASGVNYVELVAAATTNGPIIEANGTDTNETLNINPKGTGTVTMTQAGAGATLTLINSAGTCTHTPGSSSETVSCSSDKRLKENIKDAPDVLPWLGTFHIRQYDLKATGQHIYDGVVAQEVAEKHPRMVHDGPNGFLTVDAIDPWSLVKAIQEEQSEIELLRTGHMVCKSWLWGLYESCRQTE